MNPNPKPHMKTQITLRTTHWGAHLGAVTLACVIGLAPARIAFGGEDSATPEIGESTPAVATEPNSATPVTTAAPQKSTSAAPSAKQTVNEGLHRILGLLVGRLEGEVTNTVSHLPNLASAIWKEHPQLPATASLAKLSPADTTEAASEVDQATDTDTSADAAVPTDAVVDNSTIASTTTADAAPVSPPAVDPTATTSTTSPPVSKAPPGTKPDPAMIPTKPPVKTGIGAGLKPKPLHQAPNPVSPDRSSATHPGPTGAAGHPPGTSSGRVLTPRLPAANPGAPTPLPHHKPGAGPAASLPNGGPGTHPAASGGQTDHLNPPAQGSAPAGMPHRAPMPKRAPGDKPLAKPAPHRPTTTPAPPAASTAEGPTPLAEAGQVNTDRK